MDTPMPQIDFQIMDEKKKKKCFFFFFSPQNIMAVVATDIFVCDLFSKSSCSVVW